MTIKGYKRKYYICKDDNGKMIYAGDTVEVIDPMETRTPHQSIVYWNRLDGAFIEKHPSHKAMGMGGHRSLSDYLGKRDRSCWQWNGPDEEDTFIKQFTSCVKVKSFYKA